MINAVKTVKSRFTLVVTVTIVAVILFILYGLGLFLPVQSFGLAVIKPVQKVVNNVFREVADFFSVFSSIGELDEENQKLKLELDSLKSQNARLKEFENENKVLREQLGFEGHDNFKQSPVFVIGRDPNLDINAIMIDKGKKNGVEKDMPVIASSGILVGYVFEAYDDYSKVLLITDKNSVINAVVQDTRATGNIKGQHGIGLLMESIPQNESVKEGDTVVTSGLSGQFPKGLLIGKVESVQESQNQLFKEARVSPSADFEQLEICFVITSFK